MIAVDQALSARPHGQARDAYTGRRQESARAKARVLLIEDDDAVATLFVTLLSEEGYAVERVAHQNDALAIFAARGPRAVDLVLTVPFGRPLDAPYAWLDRLKARTRAPIAICARVPAVLYADHRIRGYAAYLEEPFDIRDLLDLVDDLCAP